MKQEFKEYLQSLKPSGFPNGNDLVAEGRRMAADIPWKKNRFLEEHGWATWEEYCQDCRKRGREVFMILMGLSTLEEQLEALKVIEKFSEDSGIEARSVQMIPSSLVGLPESYWENAPRPTSYLMRGAKDWEAHKEAASVDVCWEDWHLSSPNNLEETKFALNAGTSRLGSFAQFLWDFPGWHDDHQRFEDMFRTMGILSAYRDRGMTAASYPEDGMAGYFMDLSSMLGYVMLEHYIIEDLCHARMTMGYGGLMPELVSRMAFGLACEKLFGGRGKQFLTYYNGSTNTQWDHDIEANYSIGAAEMMLQTAVNRKYNLAVAHKPVSITEALRVPTLEELLNIVRCGAGAAEKAADLEQFIDFKPFEEMRDLLIEKGGIFFRNILEGFKESGIDITDPLEMVLTLRRCDPIRLEWEFHASIQEYGEFRPYVATSLYRQTVQKQETLVADLKAKGYEDALRGQRVICASADGHSYGLLFITGTLRELGAQAVNGGVNMEPAAVLDLAEEMGTDQIAISIHCGQSLDYARQLTALAKERKKSCRIVMGGVLNAMLPGYTEPVDVSALISEMGIYASNDLETQVNALLAKK